MANNYIEEFFIAIGFDTKRVKKEAKEIDKILDDIVNKKRDKINQETKDKTKAHKLARQSEADNFKFFLKQEKLKQDQIKKTEAMMLAREKRAHSLAASIRRSAAFQSLKERGRLGDFEQRIGQARREFVRTGDVNRFRDLKAEVTRTNAAMSQLMRTQVGLHTVQGGLTDSTRNMIRSYASLFALLQGTTAVKRIGQDFQGMQASMLAASGSSEQAIVDMQFINGIVDEMGLNLKDTTDAFVKFKFAAKGKMDQGQIEELFEGVSQFGTALKVAPEDMKRAQKALSQMMSKGVVMSEELKQQLGDALPGAVQVFSRALGLTEAELFKQMEQGKVMAAEVLPKVAKEYKKAAIEGGAYETALKGLRVTEGRFLTQSQKAADKIFKGGFSAGLSELYETLGDVLKDSGPQLEKIGQVFGLVFRGIAHGFRILEPLFKLFIDNMELAFGVAAVTKIATFGKAIQLLMGKFLLLFGVVEELASLLSDKLVGSIERSLGKQINITEGTTRALVEKNGQFFDAGDKAGATSRFLAPLAPQDLVGSFGLVRRFLAADAPIQQTPAQVTIHNTFPNVDVDSFNRIQEQAYHDAIHPQSR